ncbi:LamG-like jellyroll fold domain-containing protein [Actinokineospora sp. UTMC 2448]|uniref:LamG-like jellyroll fold domain-containing protein n=1 Tax=Actinokineospora sp. UTMC 2448 TaxID=2268449 RepID=UPI002164DF19|nr:LamG-like jellyroll fold domain-containing protein [Actinokineospora sp. UTMC 2448]
MDETSGDRADGQPQLRRGTYHHFAGNAQVPGPFPGTSARHFDGETSYVRLPDDTVKLSREMSIELWFKTTSTAGGVLFSIADHTPEVATAGNSSPILNVGTDGKLYGHFWQASVNGIVSAAPVNDGAWHHVVLSGSTNTQALYLDGVEVGTLAGSIGNWRTHTFLGAGWVRNLPWPAAPTDDWGHFAGEIGHVAHYQHALSAADAAAHYNARGDHNSYLSALRASASHTLWRLDDDASSPYAAVDTTMAHSTYHDVTLAAPSPMRGAGAVTFNGTSSYLRLPPDQIRGRTRLSVELWFQTSSADGGVLFSIADKLPGQTATGSTPVLYVGTDGKLYGHFWQGSVQGIVTDQAVNDGKWHHVALSGDTDYQWLYLDGNLVGTLKGSIGNFRSETLVGAGWLRNLDWPAAPADDWGHFDGSIGEVAVYHRPLDLASIASHYSARTVGTVVHKTAPGGHVTTYTYDPTRGGRFVSATNAEGATTVYTYDVGGFLHKVTDENGNVTTYVNDKRGNPISHTKCRDTDTGVCHTSYTSYHLNPDDALDPLNDRVIGFRDARSSGPGDPRYVTTFSYTPTGQLTDTSVFGRTGSEVRTTTHTYTAGTEAAPGGGLQPPGLLATSEDPNGGITTFSYTSAGDLASSTDAAGLRTAYTYDALGRVVTHTETASTAPDGATTTYTYDQASRVIQIVEPATTNAVTGAEHQRRTITVFNPDGTIASTSVSDAQGNDPHRFTAFTYDNHGRIATVTDPEGGVTTTEHDVYGKVIRTVDAAGTELISTYTNARRQLAAVTVKGFTGDGQAARDVVLESRAYDPAGRLASVTDAMGRTIKYTYYDDNLLAAEHLADYQDPAGTTRDLQLTAYTYTGNGKIATSYRGDGRYSTTYEYDLGGRLFRATDRDGDTVLRTTNTGYDHNDNPTSVRVEDAAGNQVSSVEAQYDAMGRVLTRTTRLGASDWLTSRFTRDERGLVLAEVDPRGTATGATAADYTTKYGYDVLGRRISTTAAPVSVESHGQTATTATPVSKTGYNTYGEPVDSRDPLGNITHTALAACTWSSTRGRAR